MESREGPSSVAGLALVQLLVAISVLLVLFLLFTDYVLARRARNRLFSLQKRTQQLFRTRSRAECDAINADIERFNNVYAERIGEALPLIDCSEFN